MEKITKNRIIELENSKQFPLYIQQMISFVYESLDFEKQNDIKKLSSENSKLYNSYQFIRSYLDPFTRAKPTIKKEIVLNKMTTLFNQSNKERIFLEASNMPYKFFLSTEYWSCVRYIVLKNADFKCSLCNKSNSLQVHHRSYKKRGQELETQKDLICLCNDCHEKFHDLN